MGYEEKMKELGIILPEMAAPVAAYIPFVKVGDLVFTAGQIAVVKGELKYKGKLGREISLEQGYESARICALNALAIVKKAAGSLDNVEQIVKITGFVNSAEEFTDQPKVVNGASELMKGVFGEAGLHARSAIGVSSLPLGASVEVEMIVKLR
ncbi:RidA family protein [Candidatus Sumerlaeota bacterium]|nr:RidA family protein [Candidatus Sumerlaeota bacterium]